MRCWQTFSKKLSYTSNAHTGQEEAQTYNDEMIVQCGVRNGGITTTLAGASFTVSVIIAAFAAVFN